MDKVTFFFNKEKRSLYKELAVMLTGALILTFTPFIIGKWVDALENSETNIIDIRPESSIILSAILTGMMVLWYILVTAGRSRYIRNIAMNKTRTVLLRKIDRKNVSDIERRSSGRFVEYISNEQQNLSRMFNSDVVYIVEGVFIFGVIIILMIFTNPILALVYIILLPVTYFVIRYVVRSMKKDIANRQKSFVKMNSYLDDVSSNYSLIKMYGLEERSLNKFTRIQDKLSKHYRHVLYTIGYVSPMERILENVGFILSGIIGAVLLNNDMITTGMFLTFISYTSMMGKPLSNFADGVGHLQENSVSMNRIRKFLISEEDERHGDADANDSNGDLSFDNVTFISKNGNTVLDAASFEIAHGEHVALVGTSGSGKSSVVDLIVALEKANSGCVRYGGKDVFEYEKNSLRRSVSVIPLLPWLRTDTLMNNLRIAAPDASDEDIIRASKFIGLDKIVRRMENGYDTVVGSDIDNLSFGERQLISLVRMLLSDPKVIIFDDSFSGMDALTALRIKEKLTDFLQNRTVIVISDDVADTISVDHVLFIDSGRIITGTHDELMSSPDYAKLMDNVI